MLHLPISQVYSTFSSLYLWGLGAYYIVDLYKYYYVANGGVDFVSGFFE